MTDPDIELSLLLTGAADERTIGIATGMLMERRHLRLDAAHAALQEHARRCGFSLLEVAETLVRTRLLPE